MKALASSTCSPTTEPQACGLFGQRVQTGWMTDDAVPPTCATCGRMPDDDSDARLTWALGVENGRQVWTCDRCSRENLRSIEGKLDSAWW